MPGWAVLEHGVEDDQQLAHARYDGQALGLVGGQQTLVGIPGHGVRLERLSTFARSLYLQIPCRKKQLVCRLRESMKLASGSVCFYEDVVLVFCRH